MPVIPDWVFSAALVLIVLPAVAALLMWGSSETLRRTAGPDRRIRPCRDTSGQLTALVHEHDRIQIDCDNGEVINASARRVVKLLRQQREASRVR